MYTFSNPVKRINTHDRFFNEEHPLRFIPSDRFVGTYICLLSVFPILQSDANEPHVSMYVCVYIYIIRTLSQQNIVNNCVRRTRDEKHPIVLVRI